MKHNSPVFFAAAGATIAITALSAAFLILPGRAHAYAVGPITPSASGTAQAPAPLTTNYDFGQSFQNLISPFTDFFNNMKSSGGSISIKGGATNGTGGGPNVTVTFSLQQYIDQFDAWFYGLTGVHVQGLLNIIIGIFGWLFEVADGLVMWVVHFFEGLFNSIH